MAEGLLPNFSRLAATGAYRPLQTTYPALSPVAWSSFSTGTHPARHNIFDFLDRDRRTYLPRLSSTRIGKVERFFRLGKYLIPQAPAGTDQPAPLHPVLDAAGRTAHLEHHPAGADHVPARSLLRRRAERDVRPRRAGHAGDVPAVHDAAGERTLQGGRHPRRRSSCDGDRVEAVITGPENAFVAGNPPLEAPLALALDRGAGRATLTIGETSVPLEPGRLSDWVSIRFPAAPTITVAGIARCQLLEMGEHVSLYMSPINLDPEQPAMPISHPGYYAGYLAKRHGPFATLGLAEDTWALNEGVTDDATFLQQAHDIDDERRTMCLTALDRLRRGTLVCVFDATDRIQHMFWRYLDASHPAHRTDVPDAAQARDPRALPQERRARGRGPGQAAAERRVDGALRPRLQCLPARGQPQSPGSCARATWPCSLAATASAEWLRDVDWTKTRAYCVGLSGMYLNLRGREQDGVVAPGVEAAALKAEIIGKLRGLRDAERAEVGVREAFDTATLYSGPYLENAPDLIIGYNAGYRASWDGATGVVAGPVFEDNTKAWSGDHCIDPRLVPGVFFCNRKVTAEGELSIVDVAPTALRLFGLDPPAHMDGRPWAVAS